MTDEPDRTPTAAERMPMDWWNALTERERRDLMDRAHGVLFNPSVAEAWNLLLAGTITGPALPAGAAPVDVPPRPAPRSPHVRAFNCPCCGKWLGDINPLLPGLIWCRECKLEITTKHEPNPPIV